jgi:hypothetical protein
VIKQEMGYLSCQLDLIRSLNKAALRNKGSITNEMLPVFPLAGVCSMQLCRPRFTHDVSLKKKGFVAMSFVYLGLYVRVVYYIVNLFKRVLIEYLCLV